MLNEQIRSCSEPCIIDGCCGQRFIAAGMTGREIEIRGIPGNVHPGAAKFYEEKGLKVPGK